MHYQIQNINIRQDTDILNNKIQSVKFKELCLINYNL